MLPKLPLRSGGIALVALAIHLTRISTVAADSQPYLPVPTDYLQRIISNDGWDDPERALGTNLWKHPGAMSWNPGNSFSAVFGFGLDPFDPGTVERNTVYVFETTSAQGLGGGGMVGPLIQLGYRDPFSSPGTPDEFMPLGDFVEVFYSPTSMTGEWGYIVTMSKTPLSAFNIPTGSPSPNAILFVDYGHGQVTGAIFGPENISIPEPSTFVQIAVGVSTLILFGRRWF